MSDAQATFREVWVDAADGQMMTALINGDLGFLLYMRWSGDAGFTSRNPRYEGDPDERVEYELSNGQRDYHPRAWALPLAEVEQALEYFRRMNKPPPFISWHNDSRDGVQIGAAD